MSKIRQIISKRFKKTKTGKILHRTCGQNHYNSSESSKKRKNKRKDKPLSKGFRKTIKQQLSQ
jgi:ribosomal protein L35